MSHPHWQMCMYRCSIKHGDSSAASCFSCCKTKSKNFLSNFSFEATSARFRVLFPALFFSSQKLRWRLYCRTALTATACKIAFFPLSCKLNLFSSPAFDCELGQLTRSQPALITQRPSLLFKLGGKQVCERGPSKRTCLSSRLATKHASPLSFILRFGQLTCFRGKPSGSSFLLLSSRKSHHLKSSPPDLRLIADFPKSLAREKPKWSTEKLCQLRSQLATRSAGNSKSRRWRNSGLKPCTAFSRAT